ncbi:hypothetical protein MAR_032063, partial [Mya arenaria]
MASNNTTNHRMFFKLRDGYDIPVHIPAIVCIAASLLCAVAAITLSFRRKSYRTFFIKWSKSERLVVYLSTCDALFSVSHLLDHIHIVITKDHVRPKELCAIYGFMLTVFITAQVLIVNVVAINAFVMMYFNKKIFFGKYDSGLLVWTFGCRSSALLLQRSTGSLDQWEARKCFIDALNGTVASLIFTTIPLPIIMTLNTLLYIMTWFKIRNQANNLKKTLGPLTRTANAPYKAARNMSMFVLALFVQWSFTAVFGSWAVIVKNPAKIPEVMHDFGLIFSNLGGIMNLVIFVKIRKNDQERPKHDRRINNKPATEA